MTGGSELDGPDRVLPGARRPKATAAWRKAGGWLAAAAFCACLAFAGGFVLFLRGLQREEVEISTRTDAVIALTGGPERISEAVDHLVSGNAGRLLITGVHSGTTAARIAELAPAARAFLRCCIDLDHQARNTVGNAAEAERWMRERGFRSALVVTSSYHMPRAMVELERHMPGVRLVPAPVVTSRLSLRSLPGDPPLLRLLVTEYAKFVVASARAGLTSRPRSDDIARLGGRQGS